MSRYYFRRLWLLLMTVPCFVQAQTVIPNQLATIQKQLAGMSDMSYDYDIEQLLPDGTVNKMKGRMERKGSYYTESNPEELIIQDQKWWYKLDHVRKTVFIINTETVRNKFSKKGTDVFAKPVSIIPDSILSKYGTTSVNTEEHIAKIRISFSKDVMVQELYLEYDLQKQLPLVYKVRMLVPYAIDNRSFDESYATQTLTATHFDLKPAEKDLKLAEYFSYEGGKIKLKKYKDYKLIQQL